MQSNDILAFTLISIIASIALFLIFRPILHWYWKINEMLSAQNKTNVLLEKILLQLGASDVDELTIEDISTGEKKTIQISEWVKYTTNNIHTKEYKIVKTKSFFE